jgi:hypothetical protein
MDLKQHVLPYLNTGIVKRSAPTSNIKRDLQEVGGDCGDWMERAQDRDRWRTLVNTVMNFRVPLMQGIS